MPAPKDPEKARQWKERMKGRSPWNKGKKLSGDPKYEEQYRIVSEFNKKRIHVKGTKRKPYTWSEGSLEKIAEVARNRVKSEAEKLAISKGNKGKKFSEETRQKMKISVKNRPKISSETKEKMSEKRRLYWENVKTKRPYSGPQFKQGFYFSTKAGNIRYKSSFELKFYELLDSNSEVERYEVEPLKVRYLYEGKYHTYFPDARIFYTDGRCEIAEVKPKSRLRESKNQAKFRASKLRFGNDFKIYTEEHLGL